MTCRMLTPWWRPRIADTDTTRVGGVEPTRILDWHNDVVSELVAALACTRNPRARLQDAHGLISIRVRPVYALDDQQPVSVTLARGRGSCSQRLAVLEAVARASGIATRSRGLLVDGSFWYPRFPRLRFIVPDVVLLAWPEFRLDGQWVSATELFGPVEQLSTHGGFTNSDGETLFDALARTAVDWDGVTSTPGTCSMCDLSATVVADLGRFNSRDQLFATHGQTMCWPARTLAEPFLGHWSAHTSRTVA